jgi:hypothetical protein
MRDNGKFYKRDSEAECPNLRAGRSGLASQLLPGFGITGVKRVMLHGRPKSTFGCERGPLGSRDPHPTDINLLAAGAMCRPFVCDRDWHGEDARSIRKHLRFPGELSSCARVR